MQVRYASPKSEGQKDHEKAKKVGKNLSDVLVLDADGLDIEFLTSENIEQTDCFIAATENEQTNILASLLVKHYGVKQVILHITTTNYIRAVRRIGVDAVVSKNISAVNDIINFILSDEEELPVSRIEDVDVDALEITVADKCMYLQKHFTLDKLPDYLCIGAGIWEEVLFRLILLNLIIIIISKFNIGIKINTFISIFIISIIFSTFHFIGENPDLFTFYSFNIRFIGNMICIHKYLGTVFENLSETVIKCIFFEFGMEKESIDSSFINIKYSFFLVSFNNPFNKL